MSAKITNVQAGEKLERLEAVVIIDGQAYRASNLRMGRPLPSEVIDAEFKVIDDGKGEP